MTLSESALLIGLKAQILMDSLDIWMEKKETMVPQTKSDLNLKCHTSLEASKKLCTLFWSSWLGNAGRDGRDENFLSSISPVPLLAILCLVALPVGCLFGNAKPCDVTLRGSYGGLDGKHVASLGGTQVLVHPLASSLEGNSQVLEPFCKLQKQTLCLFGSCRHKVASLKGTHMMVTPSDLF